MKKVCTKCEIEKELEEFYKSKNGKFGVTSRCKTCEKDRQKEYYEQNIDKIRKYREENKDKIREKQKEYRGKNIDKLLRYGEDYRKKNKNKLKESMKRYYEQNKDKILRYSRGYREENKDNISEREKRYRERNKDKIRERKKGYYEQNKDEILRYSRGYREENKDKISEYQKKYYQSEHGKMIAKINSHKRRAKKKEVAKLGTYTIEEWQEAMQFFNNKCAWSGKLLTNENKSTDHINPINKGGTNNINNVVPCDRSINSSKNDSDWEEWYPKQPFYSKEREKKIREWIELKTAISLFD